MKNYSRENRIWTFFPGFLVMITALAFVGMLSSCSQTEVEDELPTGTLEAKNEDMIIVGVSQVGSESVWRTANSDDIQKTFTSDKGYFLIFDNARQKQENQIKAIRKFISLQVDYIVFSPIAEDGWETVLTEAKDAGIPVILMDRRINVKDSDLYASWAGSDFEKEGKDAGLWLADELDRQGRNQDDINIVILKGTKGSTSELGRSSGFLGVAKEHDNWNILEEVDAEYTTAKGKEEMKRFLRKYPDIDVLVSQNDDMTFGALEAIKEAGLRPGTDGDIMVISFDATRNALEKVRDGEISVDVECNPLLGEKIERIIHVIQNETKLQKEYYVTEEVFTKDNVEEALPNRTY